MPGRGHTAASASLARAKPGRTAHPVAAQPALPGVLQMPAAAGSRPLRSSGRRCRRRSSTRAVRLLQLTMSAAGASHLSGAVLRAAQLRRSRRTSRCKHRRQHSSSSSRRLARRLRRGQPLLPALWQRQWMQRMCGGWSTPSRHCRYVDVVLQSWCAPWAVSCITIDLVCNALPASHMHQAPEPLCLPARLLPCSASWR